MDIVDQLREYGIEYKETDDDITFMDVQKNLGAVIQYDLGAYECHFWDANGWRYSPKFFVQDLDELLEQFDKLILSYYQDNLDNQLFNDWHSMDLDVK
jgi:hypothetical protein